MSRLMLTRLDTRTLARTAALMYGILGLVVGGPFVVAGLMSGNTSTVVLGLVMIVAYPGMTFVMTALMAWLYNQVAGKYGGVEVEVEHPARRLGP